MDFLPGKAITALLLALLIAAGDANADITAGKLAIDNSCLELEWRRGKPYSYYDSATRASTGTFRGGLLYLVESVHFTDDVRNLVKGSTGSLIGDLMFVITSIPNHPAGLDAYSRYEYQLKHSELFRSKQRNDRLTHSADCFFMRANQVFPNNAETLLVWGIHQFRNKRFDAAQQIFERAVTIAPGYFEAHYNLGLVYVELKDAANARKHATIAYDAGYPLQGLKNKLANLEQQ